MESYVFDIILITLAIVIILHLVYNNALFANPKCDNFSNGDSNNDVPNMYGKKTYDDGKYRDPGTFGIDRTNNPNNWYHVANKLVTNTSEQAQEQTQGEQSNNSEENLREALNERALHNLKGRLVFDDYYEGRLTSDPFIGDNIKVPSTFGTNTKYSDEAYTDVYGNVCKVGEENANIKRYIRDYVLDGMAQCGCVVDKSKSDFTRSEVDEYREKQLRFQNKINGTSSPAEDPVDKMNKITLQEGIKANGQAVADFYDDLVDVRVANLNGPGFMMGTSIPNNKCVKPPVFDASSGVPQGYYTQDANAGGKYILRDNWMYNNENPNNGGNIYDGITAYDPMVYDDRMI
jgi:hypothetical protein